MGWMVERSRRQITMFPGLHLVWVVLAVSHIPGGTQSTTIPILMAEMAESDAALTSPHTITQGTQSTTIPILMAEMAEMAERDAARTSPHTITQGTQSTTIPILMAEMAESDAALTSPHTITQGTQSPTTPILMTETTESDAARTSPHTITQGTQSPTTPILMTETTESDAALTSPHTITQGTQSPTTPILMTETTESDAALTSPHTITQGTQSTTIPILMAEMAEMAERDAARTSPHTITQGTQSPTTPTLMAEMAESDAALTSPHTITQAPVSVSNVDHVREFDEGMDGVLRCTVTGIPQPTVTWIRDSWDVLQTLNGRFQKFPNGSLVIRNITMSDAGVYQCVGRIMERNEEKSLNTRVNVNYSPKLFQLPPEEVYTWLENPINISCSVHSVPPATITWIHHGQNLPDISTSVSGESSVSSTIEVKVHDLSDWGVYTCLAENRLGQVRRSTQVRQGAPVSVSNIDPVREFDEGMDGVLRCTVTGIPQPTVTWIRDSWDVLQTRNGRFQKFPNGSLVIRNITMSDAGVYQCVGRIMERNEEKSLNTRVNVNYSPKLFQLPPEEVYTWLENPINISCSVHSVPPATITWIHHGQNLPDISTSVSGESSVSSTIEVKVHDLSDWGVYTCLAENRLGQVRRSTQVRQGAPVSVSNIDPVREFDEGMDGVLRCTVTGIPQPTVTWIRDSWDVLQTRNGRFQKFPNGSLVIRNITMSDAGVYQCVGRIMERNEVKSLNTRVNVNYSPKLFQLPPEEVYTWLENPINISCSVHSVPPATITWIHHGQNLPDISTSVSGESSVSSTIEVKVHDLSDWGVYTCLAENRLGQVRRSTQVRQGAPVSVSNIDPVREFDEGMDGVLRCTVTGIPQPTVTWIRDSWDVLQTRNGRFQKFPNGSLVIRNITMSDAGVYQCVGRIMERNEVKSLNTRVNVNYSPKLFQLPPEEVYTWLENPINISCSVHSVPPATITWIHHGQNLPDISTSVSGESSVSSTIEVKVHDLSDWGVYTCLAENRLGQVRRSTQVRQGAPVSVSNVDPVQEFDEGMDGVLRCTVTGIPQPTVTWIRDSWDVLQSLNGRFQKFPNGSLVIRNITMSDAGVYQCVGRIMERNEVKSLNTRVNVNYSPKLFQLPPEEVYTWLENPINISCSVHSVPPATITWIHHGQNLPDISTSVSGESSVSSTIEVKVHDLSDWGVYTCLAENRLGQVRRSTQVRQGAPVSVSNVDPVREFDEGMDGVLRCTVTGIPQPTVTWIRDSWDVLQSLNGRFQKFPNGSLVIRNITMSDAGVYQCVGRIMERNEEKSLNTRVNVNYSPKLFQLPPEEVYTWLENPINISCSVHSVPPATITWIHHGQNLPDISTSVSGESSVSSTIEVKVHDLSDWGVYTCLAENRLGQVRRSTQVRQGAPVSVSNVDPVREFDEGMDGVLRCTVTGIPQPTVTWIRDSWDVLQSLNGRFQKFPNGSLVIRNITMSDAGVYQCVGRIMERNEEKSLNTRVNVNLLKEWALSEGQC
ncbi:hemicentin-1-like [Chiloscyllium punctatum]|uniref:hemicentin-1-like n=1 Tax=Chiloscyllium punctatum TaxID=137246 RepID=UPI003B63794E